MRIDPQQTAALMIDYQEKLVPVMYEKEQLMERSSILIAGLKELGIPMYITQQYTKGLGTSVEQIWDASGIQPDSYIEKIRFSAYEDVITQIKAKKYIIVCGIEAHICVLQTVIDLAEHGFVPVLVCDCISSRKEMDRTAAVMRARQEGAIVTTYESLLFELLQEAGTPVSKRIQRLVK